RDDRANRSSPAATAEGSSRSITSGSLYQVTLRTRNALPSILSWDITPSRTIRVATDTVQSAKHRRAIAGSPRGNASYWTCRTYHVVFTLPHTLGPLCRRNAAHLYPLLFRTSAATLLEIAADPTHLGARIGFLSILHTWGQTLVRHPHVHCVVPA